MPEMSPKFNLEVVRPVFNIGETEVAALQEAVLARGNQFAQTVQMLEKVLKPARSPQVQLISGLEVFHLRRRAGVHKVSMGHNDELAGYLEDALSDTGDSVRVATWPQVNQEFRDGKILTVGQHPYFKHERDIAKIALAEFYSIDPEPDVWFNDELATSMWVARSQKQPANGLVDQLDLALSADSKLLPQRLDLGAVAVHPLIPKKP